MTNGANGVSFDFGGDDIKEQTSWTTANSDEASAITIIKLTTVKSYSAISAINPHRRRVFCEMDLSDLQNSIKRQMAAMATEKSPAPTAFSEDCVCGRTRTTTESPNRKNFRDCPRSMSSRCSSITANQGELTNTAIGLNIERKFVTETIRESDVGRGMFSAFRYNRINFLINSIKEKGQDS